MDKLRSQKGGEVTPDPIEILESSLKKARQNLQNPIIKDTKILENINTVCFNSHNRAPVRLLLSCLIAKIHNKKLDIRKPYTEIGGSDCFSGRTFDENYISPFIIKYDLPCNDTTAYLTPALRNMNVPLTPNLNLQGRPAEVYVSALELLDDVFKGKISPDDLLVEILRNLIIFREGNKHRLDKLLAELKSSNSVLPLSSEAIVNLISQHLSCPASSRLPVLVVAAAYKAAEKNLGERVLPLKSHNAADEQTGALGDVEVTIKDDEDIVTCYEMKKKRVTLTDIDLALKKLVGHDKKIDNYLIITTEPIDDAVKDYAKSMYEKTNGIEFAVLDCIGFIRYFLHLFHRLRIKYLDEYQNLLLEEPESSVRQELKEAFLALRKAAETSVR